MQNAWIDIGSIDDIPRKGARVVKTPLGCVAVFRTASDQLFALDDRCPHKGGPLSQGIVFGTSVACPLHNWTIGLADGCAQAPDEGCTARFSVRVVHGVVQLDAVELCTRALDAQRPVAGPAHRLVAVE
jgi:nitrite reductase (NADH) small subunit